MRVTYQPLDAGQRCCACACVRLLYDTMEQGRREFPVTLYDTRWTGSSSRCKPLEL